MEEFKLRDYQEECVRTILASEKESLNLHLSIGSGITTIITEVIKRMEGFIVILCRDVYERSRIVNGLIEHGVNAVGSDREDPNAKVYVRLGHKTHTELIRKVDLCIYLDHDPQWSYEYISCSKRVFFYLEMDRSAEFDFIYPPPEKPVPIVHENKSLIEVIEEKATNSGLIISRSNLLIETKIVELKEIFSLTVHKRLPGFAQQLAPHVLEFNNRILTLCRSELICETGLTPEGTWEGEYLIILDKEIRPPNLEQILARNKSKIKEVIFIS